MNLILLSGLLVSIAHAHYDDGSASGSGLVSGDKDDDAGDGSYGDSSNRNQLGLKSNGRLKRSLHACKKIPNCLHCPKNFLYQPSCVKCAKGWKLKKKIFHTGCEMECDNLAKNSKIGPMCNAIKQQCPRIPGCEKCPNGYECEKCSGSLIAFKNISSWQCVKACPYGYDMVVKNGNKHCQLQDGCMDPKCNACWFGWLRVIKANYNGPVCHWLKCPKGFGIFMKHLCQECPKGCQHCSNLKCKVCNQGLSLHNQTLSLLGNVISKTRCVAKCPIGFKSVFKLGKGRKCQKDLLFVKPVVGRLP